MAPEIIFSSEAPKPSPLYSQAVKSSGLIFVSGTGPFDASSSELVKGSIEIQTELCLTNISLILASAGSSISKIVSATVLLADSQDFTGMNSVWKKWFPIDPPARQCPQLPDLIPGLKVSISVIAEA